MERRETSTASHPDQALAKCANGQMKTRLAVLCLRLLLVLVLDDIVGRAIGRFALLAENNAPGELT